MNIRQPNRTWRRRRVRALSGAVTGFTLVELLVVVSIIALLISILLPSLKKARDQAKQVKCLANLNSLSKGNQIYGAEWNSWFLGSPMTTGQQLFPARGWAGAADVNVPRDVVQVWDWAGPMAAQTMQLHWNRAERWRTTLITGVFECPSNQLIADAYPAGPPSPTGEYAGFGPQRVVSYNTMRAMMTRSDGNAPEGTSKDVLPEIFLQYFHPQVGGSEAPPASYQPRLELVGNPSEKIFLADGSRYTEALTGLLDYSYDWKGSAGGAFSNCAPTAPDAYLTGFQRSALYPQPARYTYRHSNGPTLGLVAVYFDCHGEWMREKQSRWPDPWWPKGTKLPSVEVNPETRKLVMGQFVGGVYTVRR
ncbi:MAG: prepilin-type N-terminal cleavage/methylation domain-containing protein [Planctomycetota bacterium]